MGPRTGVDSNLGQETVFDPVSPQYSTPDDVPLTPPGGPLDLAPPAPGAMAQAKPGGGIAQALAGLKALTPGAGNIPGTPPPPHPTAGNNTSLDQFMQLIQAAGAKNAAMSPGLGILLAQGKL
jgi:hypothetical protein